MALTEEQKRKIEEEEEYRAKLRSEKPGSEKRKTHPVMGCIAVFLVVFVGIPFGIALLTSIFSPSSIITSDTNPSEAQAERREDFKAEVTFTGTQFTVTNADDFDCLGSWMSVNNKYRLEGYTLEKGQTYGFGAGEFTEGDNVRFNPYNIKPTSFSIICRGDNELSQALWTGQF